MEDLVGKRFTISGMIIEVLSDAGEQWQVRNITTRDILKMNKSVLANAIKLGKAEALPEADKQD
jgi:hypothetical protein